MVYRLALSLLLVCLTGCQAEAFSRPVSLALLGDVMLGRGVQPSAETFAVLEPDLKAADLALANLESPLTVAPVTTASPYALCAPPERVHSLVSAGFDLLSVANNHALDCGAEGLAETQRTLTAAGLGFLSSGPVYREINGIQLAFLAFNATAPEFDLETAIQAVRSARETGAIVSVSIHWGVEYQSAASPRQQEIAAQLAAAGADLIWGHHPHVLQPAAWIGKTLVLYSLGNALFDQAGLENTRQSALVLVQLDQTGVVDLRFVPFELNLPQSRLVLARPAAQTIILKFFEAALQPLR